MKVFKMAGDGMPLNEALVKAKGAAGTWENCQRQYPVEVGTRSCPTHDLTQIAQDGKGAPSEARSA